MVMATAFVVIVVATVAHVFIERPGIELGRRVATTLETRLGSFKQKDQPLTPAKVFTAHQ
jgi:peptidoglycan/LPS O-acetylase OafA/YrhL